MQSWMYSTDRGKQRKKFAGGNFMQRKILSSKNQITLISGILIVIAFIARFAFSNLPVFNWALIIASIIGVAPIAIQA